MKKLSVWIVACFFLETINLIPKYISADFYAFYQEVVEFALIFILTEKFTKWVFGENKKGNYND